MARTVGYVEIQAMYRQGQTIVVAHVNKQRLGELSTKRVHERIDHIHQQGAKHA